MAKQDLDKIIADAEKECGKELSERFTKAVQDRGVQAKADKETRSSDSKIPKDVRAVFDSALSAEMTKVQREYKDVQYSPDMTFKMKGKQWIATVKTDAAFAREKKGGASHKVAQGETVFAIAEQYYGSGAYWPAIEDENPDMVSKGDFIVCSMGIKVPSVEVVKNMDLVAEIARPKASRDADKPAKIVWEPDWEMELGSPAQTVTQDLGAVIVTITAQFKGKAVVKGKGPIPAGYNVRTGETEIKKAWKDMEAATKFNIGGGIEEISVSSAIFSGKASIKLSKDGAFSTSLETPSKSFVVGGRDCEATMSLELSLRVVPKPLKLPEPVKRSTLEQIQEWAQEHRTAILVTMAVVVVVVGAAVIISSGGAAAPGVVKFAEAAAMAAGGLKLITN